MLKKWQSPNSKKFIKIILFSSACIIISMFDFHTVHLKCFCSFMCSLNVFPTYLKNFNENFSLEYAEKMAKSKQQKIH